MKQRKPSLTLVIPLFNEEECIRKVIPELLEASKVHDVIIVDDGSSDDSYKLLKESLGKSNVNVKIIQHGFNKGYGAAIKSGIRTAHTDFVVTMDADGQHSIKDVDKMLKYMLENKVDLIIGSRANNKNQNLYKCFGKWIIRYFTNLMVRIDIKDLNSGLKMYKKENIIELLDYCPDNMSFSDSIVLISLIRESIIKEIDIEIKNRYSGRSKVNLWSFFETIMSIIIIVVLVNPLRFFLPLSLLFFLLGIAWGGYFIFTNQGVSIATSLLLILSAIIFTTGLLSEQISLIWRKRINKKNNENN
jgi:glycosyltransferase involved in cell wall biosynthesis